MGFTLPISAAYNSAQLSIGFSCHLHLGYHWPTLNLRVPSLPQPPPCTDSECSQNSMRYLSSGNQVFLHLFSKILFIYFFKVSLASLLHQVKKRINSATHCRFLFPTLINQVNTFIVFGGLTKLGNHEQKSKRT